MKDRMWAYIAGCVDCDGWISQTGKDESGALKKNYAVTVGITQHVSCKDGMERIAEFMRGEGLSVCLVDRDSNTHHNTPMLNITVKENRSVVELLEKISPYMLFKKEKAEVCISDLKDKMVRLRNVSDATPAAGAKRRYWTPEEVETAHRMKSDGYNLVAIAETLGRSHQSVAQRLDRDKHR